MAKIRKWADERSKDLKDVLGKAGVVAKDVGEKAGKKVINIAHEAENKAGEVIDDVKDYAHDTKINIDKAQLKPIFTTDDITDFEMVCVGYKDKKREDSEACNNSIGHYDIVKNGLKVLNIYKTDINKFNFEFHPNNSNGFYYISPVENNKLIRLDDYFTYVNNRRVAELHDIAYKIGASYILVSYQEEEKTLVSKSYDYNAKGSEKGIANVDAKATDKRKKREEKNLKILDEGNYHDNEPTRPDLKYFKDDNRILSLIDAALDKTATNRHINISYNTSLFMSKDTAAKVDATLKAYGASGNGSIASEVEKQTRINLDFYVEFPDCKKK